MSDSTVATVAAAIAEAWQQNKKSLSHPNNPRFVEHNSPLIHHNNLKFDYKQLKLDQNSSAGMYVADEFEKSHGRPASTKNLETLLTLNYTVEIIGDPLTTDGVGRPLYIALHRGSGPPTDTQTSMDPEDVTKTNDHYWKDMASSYKGAIRSGVWISARGIGDTPDMHYTGANYVLIERLIENMIVFGALDKRTTSPVAINPNKVYLVGFSAGGDGVYRLAPRLAQRFAAVNMGGGHPGSVILGSDVTSPPLRAKTILRNLANTPICLQVGEKDKYLDRSQLVAQSAMDLNMVKAYYTNVFRGQKNSVYDYCVNIHPTNPDPQDGDLYEHRHKHWEEVNFNWSNPMKDRGTQPVIDDYATWRTTWANDMPSSFGTTQRKTNAIDWLDRKTRQPLPEAIVWDLSRGGTANDQFGHKVFEALSANGAQNYWLDVSGQPVGDVGSLIEARIDKETSTIYVTSAGKYLRILLRPEMVRDMSKVKVQVNIGGQVQTLGPYNLGWNQAVINQTLARNDPNLIFSSDIVMTLDGKIWQGTTSSPGTTDNPEATNNPGAKTDKPGPADIPGPTGNPEPTDNLGRMKSML